MVLSRLASSLLAMLGARRAMLYSLADQGTSALALFLFTTLATKALPQEEFGRASVYLAWASLVGALLQPVLIDASGVLTARSSGDDGGYRRAANRAYLILGATALLVAMALSVGEGVTWLPATLAWLLASELAVSAVAFLRRSAYVPPGHAVRGWAVSALNLGLTAVVMPMALGRDGAGAADMFLARACINGATVLASVVWWPMSSGGPWPKAANMAPVAEMVRFSRIYVAGSLVFWVTNSLQLALIGHVLGLDEAAGYRVAQLLMLPAAQLQAAIYQIALPRAVAWHARDAQAWPGHTRRLLHAFVWPVLAYALLVGVGADSLLTWLFGAGYADYAWVVWILGGMALFDAIKQVAVVMLYAQNRQSLFMRYRVVALGLFVVTMGPALHAGSLAAVLLASAVSSVLLLAYLLHGFLAHPQPSLE